ncbi:MAG: cytochrome c biogenesis protein CcsA [Candidatus Riflebacteria bacterium]|nr:cytochrome c biogenesis protein CcsA [Candidatus Riflebacteria bacterium]
MQVLVASTLLAYALATFFRVKEKVAGRSLPLHANLSFWLGLVCNAILALEIFAFDGIYLHYRTLFIVGALSLALCTAAIERLLKENFFSIFTLPASFALMLCSIFAGGKLSGGQFAHGWFALHMVLAILGECFFLIAAVSSVTYLFVVRRLKKKNRLRAVFFFPPLARLDDLTFKLIVFGTAVFAAGLAIGLYGNLSYFAGFTPGGKHIFAGFVLVFYLALIITRRPFKLTGNRLAMLAVAGFLLSVGLMVIPDNSVHWQPLETPAQETVK